MTVNEGEGDTADVHFNTYDQRLTSKGDVWKVDQHPTGQTLTLPVGMTVRFHHNNKTRLCEVIEKDSDDAEEGTKIRVLNSKESHLVPESAIAPICEPEPSDVLQHPDGTSEEIMEEVMSQKRLKSCGMHLIVISQRMKGYSTTGTNA